MKGLITTSTLREEQDTILNLCKSALRKNEDIQHQKCHPAIQKMSQSIAMRINNIAEICSVQSYNLFFNGKIAVGKSTAICTILGLIKGTSDNSPTFLSNHLLLKTGTGRMTVCETRIIPRAKKSLIRIEPVSSSCFESYLTQFCQWLLGIPTDISQEHIRLIKNMARLPQKYKSPEDLLEYCSELKNEPLIYLKNMIDYEDRTQLIYERGEENFEVWMKETYEQINDGLLINSPMPSQIIVEINENDFSLNLPPYVSSIVDTRGIDLGERADIQNYILQKDSLSFMCENIKDLGSNDSVMSILQQVLIKENKDTRLRVGFLCLAENGELDSITDCNTRAEGIDEKKEQLRKKLREKDISFETKNITFYESATGFHFDNKRVSDIDTLAIKKSQKGFWDEVDKLVYRMYFSYYQELLTAVKTLNSFEQGIITGDIFKKFDDSKYAVSKYEDKVITSEDDIISKFKESILSIYHSSLRGAVNHNGIGCTADIYGSFQRCGGRYFSDNCKEVKEQILAAIEQIFIDSSDLENLCLESIIQKINELYSLHYNNSRMSFYQISKERLYNNASWDSPKKYWGDGLGNYNARVCNDVISEAIQKKVVSDLMDLQFQADFFKEIRVFLNIGES